MVNVTIYSSIHGSYGLFNHHFVLVPSSTAESHCDPDPNTEERLSLDHCDWLPRLVVLFSSFLKRDDPH